MSLGEIDTYNLTFDKLQALFTDTQGYYESFLDANNLYKSGQMSDKEFFPVSYTHLTLPTKA